MIDHYDWAGGREAMVRFPPAQPGSDAQQVVVLPALFEEHNRTRSFTVAICRGLAALGIGVLLPDLPGQNESRMATDKVTLDDWRNAVRDLVAVQSLQHRLHIASIRGGALTDGVDGSASVWRLAPLTGRAVLRDLERTALIGTKASQAADTMVGLAMLAGNAIGAALYATLLGDDVLPVPAAPVRTVRLEGDVGAADVRLPGAPLWRQSEPGNDETLAQLIAADIAVWIARCAG